MPTAEKVGVNGCALITTSDDADEVQFAAFVTVKLYVVDPVNPLIVVLLPVPVTLPGLIVQLPVGKPLNNTLPVDNEHVGCVMVPTTGADGAVGSTRTMSTSS